MLKKNEIIKPISTEVSPNGFYLAYHRFFDEVLSHNEFDYQKLKELYVFDRHVFAEPKFTPSKGWEKIEAVDDPELRCQFEIDEKIGKYEKELLTFLLTNVKPKILKIVGEIGTGKSTFLQNMFFNYLPRQHFATMGLYFLYINLEKVFQQHENYSYEDVIELVAQEFQYAEKESSIILSNSKLPQCPRRLDDVSHHLQGIVKIFRPNNVIICFDNVDVFKPSFQQNMWRITEGLSLISGATFIVAMREINSKYFEEISNSRYLTYFLMEQRSPVLAKVIERRLKYLLTQDPFVKEIRKLKIKSNEVTVVFSDLEEFITNFVKIIFSEEISSALDNLSNYNIRIGLLWILTFIQSWNLNVNQMVTKLAKNISLGNPIEPFATFDTLLNAIALRNHRIYFPNCSAIENIFSANLRSSPANLLVKYRCLRFCQIHGDSTPKRNLVLSLQNIGYTLSEIDEALNQLLAYPKRLLFSYDGNKAEEIITLGITPAGKFYLNRLIYYLDYFELISDDCFLPAKIKFISTTKYRSVNRINNVIRFVKYIGEIELNEIENLYQVNRMSFNEYQKIYGNELLAVNILYSLKTNIRTIFNSMHWNPLANQHSTRFIKVVDLIIEELSNKYVKINTVQNAK